MIWLNNILLKNWNAINQGMIVKIMTYIFDWICPSIVNIFVILTKVSNLSGSLTVIFFKIPYFYLSLISLI